MRIVCISDTHSRKLEHPIPEGDVLVHSGDATVQGTLAEMSVFANWFSSLPHKLKIFVPGNHDWLFETDFGLAASMLDGEVLLDKAIEIEGVKFYGTAWQPRFCDWAFNLERGSELKSKWKLIPDDTEVLITHSPPFGILDETINGELVGCADLFDRVMKIKPKVHIFGHIHHSYGTKTIDGIQFVNASICDEEYKATQKPIVVDILET